MVTYYEYTGGNIESA